MSDKAASTLTTEVASDGQTVWVNSGTGMCLARFGPYGIDVHRDFEDQRRTGEQCLACTHERTTLKDWWSFQTLTRRYHGIVVGDDHMPRLIREELMRA